MRSRKLARAFTQEFRNIYGTTDANDPRLWVSGLVGSTRVLADGVRTMQEESANWEESKLAA